jgi:hypothetical protein
LPKAIVLRQTRAINPPVRRFGEQTLVKACKELVAAGIDQYIMTKSRFTSGEELK